MSSSSSVAAALSSSSSSSKKNSNFARLCCLLIDTGTQVLREVFDSIHQPTSLHAVLHSTSVHRILRQLKSRRILNDQQWSILYPTTSTSVSSASFDITLLFALLRNICNLTPPPTGWDKPPAASDLSKEADLVRIKWYRYKVYAHRTDIAVSDAEFEILWTDISAVLIRLGGEDYKTSIQRLKVEPMDSNDEKYFLKMLEEWNQLGDKLFQKMDEFLKLPKEKPVAASVSEAEDYTRKLKLSIERQTESLPVLEGQTAVSIDDMFTNVTIQRVKKDQEKTKSGGEQFVSIQRGNKRFKQYQEKTMSDREEFDDFEASTTLKECAEMFIWSENDDPNSRRPTTTNPKCILLTGKAGIGKSEFCRKMSKDWSKDGILDFKFLFLLTFCQLSLLDHEELDLCDILNRSSLLDEQSIIDKGLLQYIIENPEKVLFIFDGYDEYRYRTEITGKFEEKYPNDPRQKMPVPAIIAKIMKGKILKESVVMISSRPEEAQELLPEEAQEFKKFPFDVRCEIKGFSPLQIQEYIQKYFKDDESIKKKVLEHIKMNEILLSFGHIPVMCYLMCYYLKWHMSQSETTENLPNTRSELYYEVIKVFIKRHFSKYKEMTQTEVQVILHKLAELGIYLVKEEKFIFTEEDMKSFNFKDEEISNLKKSGLFDCCPGVKKSPFDKPPLEFVFSHLTMQEFLCALGFVEKKHLPEEEGTSEVIWTFMAGLLGRENDEELMDQLIEKIKPQHEDNGRNKVLTLHCLYEYRDDELSKRVINKLHDKYCDSDGRISFEDVNDLDCLAIRYFLHISQLLTEKQTTKHLTSTQSFIVNTLDISWSSLSPSGVSVLCESLSNSTFVTGLRLVWCELDDECVKIIAQTLNKTTINDLNLADNNITDEGVMCLCDVVSKRDFSIKLLNLYGNDRITDQCKTSVLKLIQQNKPDVMIQLEPSTFGDHTHDEGDKQETRRISRKFTGSENVQQTVTLDVKEDFYDLSSLGVLLEVPSHAVTWPTKVTCRKLDPDYSPAPATDDETLVSCIREFTPTSLQKPIIVTLKHCGPSKKEGYETLVKALKHGKIPKEWEQIEEIREDSSFAREHFKSGYSRVRVSQLTTLAVVSRVIRDSFKVTEEGCVVRSSVCDDVMVEFPVGAVDRTFNGTMKLYCIPNHTEILDGITAFPCPLIVIDGFEGITFNLPVKIRLPHPYPEGYPSGDVHVLCMEAPHEWKDITDQVQCINEHESFLELEVKHFSGLWAWIHTGPETLVSSLSKYLYKHPQHVRFAVFKKNIPPNTDDAPLRMALVCLPNKPSKQFNLEDAMKDLEERGDYTRLAYDTSTKPMRPNDKAYIKVEGCYQNSNEDICLMLIENEVFRKELFLEKSNSGGDLVIFFLESKDDDVKDNLCEIRIHKMEILSECQAHSLDDVYKMTSNPRGLFIIINMEKFTNPENSKVKLKERKGSEQDAKNLKKLFKGFGFQTEILCDKGKQYLLFYLKTKAENPELENHDCFGLCIMSHGEDDYFYASDRKRIKVTEIRDMFKKCEGLKGKPKLFFIQACRGALVDPGVRIRSDDIPHRRPAGNQQETISSVRRHYDEGGTIPEDADILMAYGCVEGQKSFRDKKFGTFFIQSLVEVFREHYREEDLMSMLTRVNKKVSELVGIDGAKQMPEPKTTLRKKVYFS